MRRCRLEIARASHVNRLANTMREIDTRECWALYRTPKEALRLGLRTSLHALTAIDEENDRPLAMMGVMPTSLLTGSGVPWFLGTDDVFEYGRDLVATGPAMIDWFHETFATMSNIVSVENVRAIRLLERWGAEVGGEPVIHRGIEFVPFTFKRPAIQAQSLAA